VLGVLAGFGTIGAVIGLGALLAHWRVLDISAQKTLVRLSFFVASPALIVTVLAGTDVSQIFSANLIASVGSVVVAATVWVLLARLLWKRSVGETVIGAFGSAYVNAGNLGLPIAAYALGDASLIVPMLLTQLLVLQPAGLMALDLATSKVSDLSKRAWVWYMLTRPFRNPMTVGSLVGLLLSITGVKIPALIDDPLQLVAHMAVPGMLLAYGVSLRLGPLPGAGESKIQVGTIVGLKNVVQPLVAYLIARYAVGLGPADLFAVTVIAALPTAQNVFTHAVRYDTGVVLARDTIFVSTVLAVPGIIAIAALLA
jgi:malonate transporter and related proteins